MHIARRSKRIGLWLSGTVALIALLGLTASSGRLHSLGNFIAPISAAHGSDASPEEAAFLADNESAMSKMMAGMSVGPSGDVDRDFVAMMVPHHQGAIEMAQAELRYGHNDQLRRMAQEIIVTQQQEIAVMKLAIGETSPPAAGHPGHDHH
jgi:hypothetical protein